MLIRNFLRTLGRSVHRQLFGSDQTDIGVLSEAGGGRINPQLAERFSTVFRSRLWGEQESLSGPGSRLDNPMVVQALEALDHAIQALKVQSVADIPCGDFNWFRLATQKHPDLRYTGFDIVDELVNENRKRYPGVEFVHFDVVSDVPGCFDLVFTKELFIHLKDRDIFRAIANMKASGSKYLIASNSFGVTNVDLRYDELGYARPVDLCVEPYNFPKPVWRNHFYAAWKLSDISLSKTVTE